MRTVTTRRICQAFFLLLFVWFCVAATLGDRWYQLRGWPVNWVLELDPLIGLATLLTTATVYAGLAWGLATLIATVLFGRAFCGWLCPFGTLQQMVGWLGWRRKTAAERIRANRYHPAQSVKYYVLLFLLAMAALEPASRLALLLRLYPWIGIPVVLAIGILPWSAVRAGFVKGEKAKETAAGLMAAALLLIAAGLLLRPDQRFSAAFQIGLLDPIALVYRSVNLVVLALADRTTLPLSAIPRVYEGTRLIGAIFIAALLLTLRVPRFYCRFVCPLGALLGLISRFSLWRIGRRTTDCSDCRLCAQHCEGACEPTQSIRTAECVMCVNCLDDCRHDLMTYQIAPSAGGEIIAPDLGRRGLLLSLFGGAAAVPLLRFGGALGANWNPALVRPPGSLKEAQFLSRCIKCGQCMRVCPTNVIHPAGLGDGLEALWTPRLNFRIGTSGCHHTCIACGSLCPTAAIRPITQEERLGKGAFADAGPIKIGCAFVDRGRCLPWAMGRPCIVCQENCPVSPKAITTAAVYRGVDVGAGLTVKFAGPTYIELNADALAPDLYATGDFFCTPGSPDGGERYAIVRNSARFIEIEEARPFAHPPAAGSLVSIQIRLQQPYVDPQRCIGCGVCENVCPVRGLRAIRVTAENESRNREHGLLI